MNKKLKILLNYIIGPLVFAWVCFAVYNEIASKPDFDIQWKKIQSAFYGNEKWMMITVVLLMLVNWGIEARKWQVLMNSIQNVSFWKAYKAVFSGQSLAVTTPNRVGEFAGRVVYLDEGKRLKGIALTIVGSFSQSLVTLIFGLIGTVIVRNELLSKNIEAGNISDIWIQSFIYIISIVTFVLFIVYYKLSWLTKLVEKIPFVKKYTFLIEKLEDLHWKELTRILLLSVLRFVIFILQFILLLKAFGITIALWTMVCLICVLYLTLMLPPTITLLEGSFRVYAAKMIFGLFTANILAVECASLGIWLINLIVPAIAGGLFMFGIKIFKKKSNDKVDNLAEGDTI